MERVDANSVCVRDCRSRRLSNAVALELIPKALSRTALAAVNARKTVASAKTAHLKSLFWDRLLVPLVPNAVA